MYRRNEDGKVVKKDDHLMDCIRYFVLSGRDYMETEKPYVEPEEPEWPPRRRRDGGDWMGM